MEVNSYGNIVAKNNLAKVMIGPNKQIFLFSK